MMSPQLPSKTEWDKMNTVMVTMKLNKNKDADILAWLDTVESKQGSIKEAIRAYMNKEDAK